MSSPPLVSLGMPVYNGERYLPRTLECLLNQSFTDFELIISDNASTDRTAEICKEFAARDSRVRYLRQPYNMGAADNYNFVFRESRGKYFKWAAADDLCDQRFLEQCVQVLEEDESIVLCYAKTRIIGPDDELLREYDDRVELNSPHPAHRFRQLVQMIGECNAVFGVIRSRDLETSSLIGKYIGSDVCLLIELSLRGKFYELPERLFLRREHDAASSCNRTNEEQLYFFDPRLSGKIALPRWRRQFENFRTIRRSNLPLSSKVDLTLFLLRVFWWHRLPLTGELTNAAMTLGARLFNGKSVQSS